MKNVAKPAVLFWQTVSIIFEEQFQSAESFQRYFQDECKAHLHHV
jgi:hypothetical protein